MTTPITDEAFAASEGPSNVGVQHSGLTDSETLANAASNLLQISSVGVDDGNGGVAYSVTVSEFATDPSSPTGYAGVSTQVADLPTTAGPIDAAALDAAGDLFLKSGDSEYELSRDGPSSTGYSAPVAIAQFSQLNWHVAEPQVVSSAGNVFGAGIKLDGADAYFVYEIAKDANAVSGFAAPGVFTTSAVHSYSSNGLAIDGSDNLFALAYDFTQSVSSVEEYAKDDASATGYAATPTLLGSVDGFDNLIVDPAGDLFAWNTGGDVYEIAKDAASATGYAPRAIAFQNCASNFKR